MEIEKVKNKEEAKVCDQLLSLLVNSESKFNTNIKSDYIVKDYFSKIFEQKHGAIFIAKENEEILGYVYCRITSSDDSPEIEKEALIDGIYVRKEHRNKGIATQLLAKAKQWCTENQVKYVYINVLEKNEIALNLYKSLGYEDFEKKLKLEI